MGHAFSTQHEQKDRQEQQQEQRQQHQMSGPQANTGGVARHVHSGRQAHSLCQQPVSFACNSMSVHSLGVGTRAARSVGSMLGQQQLWRRLRQQQLVQQPKHLKLRCSTAPWWRCQQLRQRPHDAG